MDRASRTIRQAEFQAASAVRIGRQGEIRDRSSAGQHYRMAGLNLLASIVIYWNTAYLGSIPVATVSNVNRNERLLAVSYRTTASRV